MNECVIVWTRLGPYHLARIAGAAKRLRCAGLEVTAIEVARRDHYLWEAGRSEPDSRRRTLFPEAQYCDLTQKEVGGHVTSALEEIKPEAVAINGWAMPEARAALSWCNRNGRIAVLMSETKEDDCPRRWWKEWLKARIVRKFDAALVGGRRHREYAVKLGIPEDKVFCGYDTVDNDYFCLETDRVRARLGLRKGGSGWPVPRPGDDERPDKRIHFAGSKSLLHSLNSLRPYFYANTRFIPRKNLDGLLRAYEGYRWKAEKPWSLVITGDGKERQALLRLCEGLGLPVRSSFEPDQKWDSASPAAEAKVVFPGFVQYEELPLFYGLASAFIHAASAEPWGLVVNEACASGLPVLISRTVGARYELVREGKNGYLFDPFEDRDICEKMLRLCALSPQARSKMGALSRELVSRWGPDRFGKGLLCAIDAAGGV